MPCVNFRISSLHLVTLGRLKVQILCGVLEFLEFHNLPLMHLVLPPIPPRAMIGPCG
jgi:hypothetical protein